MTMTPEEIESFSLWRLITKAYNKAKKTKHDRKKLGMRTEKQQAQMEVLTDIKSKFNKGIDELSED